MDMFRVEDIDVGHHRDGYRIDKTASAMNRYTQWDVVLEGEWKNSKPVCFHSMPEDGWLKDESFNWEDAI